MRIVTYTSIQSASLQKSLLRCQSLFNQHLISPQLLHEPPAGHAAGLCHHPTHSSQPAE